jgi:type II secretory pathway pseudopilin PulG
VGFVSRRAERGFTILEAVIALAIVGLAGVSALEAVAGELRAADRAAEAYTLAALAQDRLAAVSFVSPKAMSPFPDSLARGTFAEPFEDYHWTAKVQPVSSARALYDVTVTITGARRDYTIATRLYRPVPTGILR